MNVNSAKYDLIPDSQMSEIIAALIGYYAID
jgi:hypothetical protein